MTHILYHAVSKTPFRESWSVLKHLGLLGVLGSGLSRLPEIDFTRNGHSDPTPPGSLTSFRDPRGDEDHGLTCTRTSHMGGRDVESTGVGSEADEEGRVLESHNLMQNLISGRLGPCQGL